MAREKFKFYKNQCKISRTINAQPLKMSQVFPIKFGITYPSPHALKSDALRDVLLNLYAVRTSDTVLLTKRIDEEHRDDVCEYHVYVSMTDSLKDCVTANVRFDASGVHIWDVRMNTPTEANADLYARLKMNSEY